MEEKNIKTLQKFFNRRTKPLAETTKQKYTVDLNTYSTYQKKPLAELITEAKEEQRTRIKNNILYECDIENSKLSERMENFHQHEKDRGIAPLTLDTRINNIRAFYHGMGVKQLPRKINQQIQKNNIQIITKEKIRQSINNTNTLNRAMITFLASTGIRISDCANFTIQDYMNSLRINKLEELEKTIYNPEQHTQMIGYWEFRPQKTKNNICQVCNTPESNKHIMKYLQKRHIKHGLDPEEHLFLTSRQTKITNTYFAYNCQRINWKLAKEETEYWENKAKMGLITEQEKEKRIKGISKFHAHGLRKFFISTISGLCGNLRLLLLMEGHRSIVSTDSSYVRIGRDVVVGEYLKFIPSLSFERTEVNVLTDERIKGYERKLQQQQDRLDTLESFIGKLKNYKP